MEEPPPSGRKIATRLGSHRSHLKKIFPDIWERIVQRHTEYQKQEHTRKRAASVERIHRIATDLLIAGKYPSRRRVLPLMAGADFLLEHQIIREVRRAVLAFRTR